MTKRKIDDFLMEQINECLSNGCFEQIEDEVHYTLCLNFKDNFGSRRI